MKDPLNYIPLTWISRRPRWAFLILLAVFVVGVFGLPCITKLSTSEAVYFMTGVVLIVYSVDTHAMRKEITEQNKMLRRRSESPSDEAGKEELMAEVKHPWTGKPWAAAADAANKGLNGQGYIVHALMMVGRYAVPLTFTVIVLMLVQIALAVWGIWK